MRRGAQLPAAAPAAAPSTVHCATMLCPELAVSIPILSSLSNASTVFLPALSREVLDADIEPDVVIRTEPLGQGRHNEGRLLVLPTQPQSSPSLPLLRPTAPPIAWIQSPEGRKEIRSPTQMLWLQVRHLLRRFARTSGGARFVLLACSGRFRWQGRSSNGSSSTAWISPPKKFAFSPSRLASRNSR